MKTIETKSNNMTTATTSGRKSRTGGGSFLPALCNVLGILVLLAVIAVSLPLSLPRYLGYEIYEVVSGSMEPAIPVGSVIYVAPVAPEDVAEGDVIAFQSGEDVITHRVTENRFVVGEFVTKGDANAAEDFETVPYSALIGRVERHFPFLGQMLSLFAAPVAKLYLLVFALCGVMFQVLAAQIRSRQREKLRAALSEFDDLDLDEVLPSMESISSDGDDRRARRSRRIRGVLMVLLLVVFLFSAGTVVVVRHQYRVNEALYDEASARFTSPVPEAAVADAAPRTSTAHSAVKEEREPIVAPITVDFDALLAENPDVMGWIYCEGTAIDYPVMQAEDNDYYLHRSFDGVYSTAGSIFVEAENRPGFADANTIVYGHHMRDGSMFAGLENWADPGYYEEHPVLWLLTPEGDYRIDLIAGYTTSAASDTYTIFDEPGPELTAYLEAALEQSDFLSSVTPSEDGRYVVLSTCAYVFDNARYVLHGLLTPAD